MTKVRKSPAPTSGPEIAGEAGAVPKADHIELTGSNQSEVLYWFGAHGLGENGFWETCDRAPDGITLCQKKDGPAFFVRAADTIVCGPGHVFTMAHRGAF